MKDRIDRISQPVIGLDGRRILPEDEVVCADKSPTGSLTQIFVVDGQGSVADVVQCLEEGGFDGA